MCNLGKLAFGVSLSALCMMSSGCDNRAIYEIETLGPRGDSIGGAAIFFDDINVGATNSDGKLTVKEGAGKRVIRALKFGEVAGQAEVVGTEQQHLDVDVIMESKWLAVMDRYVLDIKIDQEEEDGEILDTLSIGMIRERDGAFVGTTNLFHILAEGGRQDVVGNITADARVRNDGRISIPLPLFATEMKSWPSWAKLVVTLEGPAGTVMVASGLIEDLIEPYREEFANY